MTLQTALKVLDALAGKKSKPDRLADMPMWEVMQLVESQELTVRETERLVPLWERMGKLAQ